MSSTSQKIGKKVLSIALPVGGFAVGWFAFTLAEDSNILSASAQRRINVANLKLQIGVQRFLPSSVVEKYGYPEEMLRSMIDSMEKGYSEQAMNDRVTFDQILSECELPEQIGFLEEHASEEIPYFYIADIFHSWARLHETTFLHAEKRERKRSEKEVISSKGKIAASPLALRDIPDLDSPILCSSLWEKMLHHVIPFDVSIRALCVLAVNNRSNAKRLANAVDINDLLTCYEEYEKQDRENEGADKEKAIDHAEVCAATVFFLHAVNEAAVHKQRIPFVGKASTGRLPLAARVDGDRWCSHFAPSMLSREDAELIAEPASLFRDLMSEKLKCSERSIA